MTPLTHGSRPDEPTGRDKPTQTAYGFRPHPEPDRLNPMGKPYDDPLRRSTRWPPERPAAPPRKRASWKLFTAIGLAVLSLAAAGILSGVGINLDPAPATGTVAPGTLTVDSNPGGVDLLINGEKRGVTPVTLSLDPGEYTAELRGEGHLRVILLTVAPGAQISHYVDLSPLGQTGTLEVRSQPDGARVLIDGAARGTTPLTVPELAVGAHEVVLEAEGASVRQAVTIEPGATASLVVPLNVGSPTGSGGWIAVTLPFEAQIFENGRLIGSSTTDRIMLPVGRHELELVNDAVGFREAQTVQVQAGRVAAIRPALPRGVLHVNAVPWAEVWIDGERAGETPLGNLKVAIGAHELTFRHPQHGERRAAVTVRTDVDARVTVDMR